MWGLPSTPSDPAHMHLLLVRIGSLTAYLEHMRISIVAGGSSPIRSRSRIRGIRSANLFRPLLIASLTYDYTSFPLPALYIIFKY